MAARPEVGSCSQPPEHLSAAARAWWRAIDAGYTLDDAAYLVLLAAMEAFDRCRDAAAVLESEGLLIAGLHGPRAHPCVLIERDARAAMLAAIRTLNLDIAPAPPQIGRR